MRRRQFVLTFTTGITVLGMQPADVLSQVRRSLTEEQALRLVFPAGQIYRDDRTLDDAQAQHVESITKFKLASRTQTIYRGETGGYAMILDEVGKDQPITFIVGVSPDFKVSRVALMVFRESRGWEVEDKRFTNQFRGKSTRDRVAIGSDIIAVTGATLSSRAFCRGTKKALAICEALFR